jgi:hypothetical protein
MLIDASLKYGAFDQVEPEKRDVTPVTGRRFRTPRAWLRVAAICVTACDRTVWNLGR